MKRGDLGKRLDYYYHKPEFEIEAQRIRNGIYPLHQLGDKLFCNKITDGTHYTPSYVDDGEDKIKFISVKDVREFEISFEDVKYISEEEHLVLSKRCNPKPGDILLTKIGTIGLAAVIPENAPIFDLFVSVCLIQPKKDIINSHFLCAVLNSPVARLQFARDLKGVGVPDLHLENIAETLIPLPPPEIQSSLVAEIEASRQIRKQKLAQADELFSSTDTYLLEKLCIKISSKPDIDNNQCFAVKRTKVGIRLDPFYNLPEHQVLESALSDCPYKVLAIGDERVVREIVEGRITPKPEFYSESQEDPIFLRAQNIEKGYLNFSDAKRLTREAFESETKAILLDGDIVLTIDGVLLGIAAVHRSSDQDCCISNHMVRLRHGIETDPEYLVWFLNSSAGQRQIKRGITGSAIPGIRTDAIERILVPIPPMDIQRSLVVEIEKRRAEAQRLRQEAETEWEAAKTRFERKLLGEEV